MAVDWRSTVTTYGTACKELPEAHADMSSAAAEIYGASTYTMDLLGLRYVAEETQLTVPLPIELQVDNSTCKTFADDSVARSKLKHIDTRQEWVKCLRDRQVFKLVHVPTVDNLADLGTKILATEVFRRLRALIMFSPPDNSGTVVSA